MAAQDLTQDPDSKAAAEHSCAQVLGERLRIIRPGLIAGPGDRSDRLGYWMNRMASDGPVLVPEDLSRPVQFIDVRDLEGAVVAGELPPVLDAVGPTMCFGKFLHTAAQVAHFGGALRSASDQWLLDHGVTYWAGDQSLPLWLSKEDRSMLNRAGKLFTALLSSIEQTLTAVLKDERIRGLRRERRAGLSHEFESSLIEQLGRT